MGLFFIAFSASSVSSVLFVILSEDFNSFFGSKDFGMNLFRICFPFSSVRLPFWISFRSSVKWGISIATSSRVFLL